MVTRSGLRRILLATAGLALLPAGCGRIAGLGDPYLEAPAGGAPSKGASGAAGTDELELGGRSGSGGTTTTGADGGVAMMAGAGVAPANAGMGASASAGRSSTTCVLDSSYIDDCVLE
jgi:hypothetical protein